MIVKWSKKKIVYLALVFFLLALGIFFIFTADFSGGKKPILGVTFSKAYALELQLDWQKTYLAILDDLKVSHLRLAAYWNEVEPQKGQYDFTDLDWQIDQASARKVQIILAVGRRLPRWPECHDPDWIKNLSSPEINNEVLTLLDTVVKRFKDNPNIYAWQVENEPLFAWFGSCPPPNEQFLKSEVALVKSLDSSRPIIVTDTGELSAWQKTAAIGDILGTTLYRIVWNRRIGFLDYWFVPPAFYRFKADITKMFHKNLKSVVVMELQMEPWTMDKNMTELTLGQQQQSFNLKRFGDNLNYVYRAGFPQVYLWGVEYWYWLKEQGHPQIWQAAQQLW